MAKTSMSQRKTARQGRQERQVHDAALAAPAQCAAGVAMSKPQRIVNIAELALQDGGNGKGFQAKLPA